MKKSEFKECDIYAARIAALRPFPKETLKSLREYIWCKDDEGAKCDKDEGVNCPGNKGDLNLL